MSQQKNVSILVTQCCKKGFSQKDFQSTVFTAKIMDGKLVFCLPSYSHRKCRFSWQDENVLNQTCKTTLNIDNVKVSWLNHDDTNFVARIKEWSGVLEHRDKKRIKMDHGKIDIPMVFWVNSDKQLRSIDGKTVIGYGESKIIDAAIDQVLNILFM